MKPIALKFTKYGSTFEQMERSGDWAIYLRSEPNKPDHWEIVRIRSHNGIKMGDSFIEPSEYYPGTGTWGTDGFTVTTWERAKDKFAEVVQSALAQCNALPLQ